MSWNNKNIINEPSGEWGGPWTEKKLEAFSKYVWSYLTIMKKYPHWKTIYFDGFAGSGTREQAINTDLMEQLKITDEEETTDDNRPDIALIFSNNPANKKPFDVVIVELKKRSISLEENMKVVTQLEKRARRLMKHYNNQIQRIWFYGIIEFNDDVEMQLAGEYTELYSSGKMYYRETNVAISLNPKVTLPIGVFIWDLDAVISDADARNSAFLNLIKSKFIQ